MQTAIRAQRVTKAYGHLYALRGIDLELAQGGFLSLFGPNGAGKSTLLRILSTLVKPTSGTVELGGQDLAEDTQELRRQIGVISHATYLYGELTALENLELYARLYGVNQGRERAEKLLTDLGLAERKHHLVRTFSRGMQQRLTIARALIHDPRFLFLDEPYTGLDQYAAQKLSQLLAELNDGQRTFILITHNLSQGLNLANQVAILAEGKLVFLKPRREIVEAEFEQIYIKYVGH